MDFFNSLLEVDAVLSDAARCLHLPDFVQIMTADALETLPALGTFNFIFADAAAVKYQRLDLVLEALQPGGLLLIDDLTAPANTSEQKRAEKFELRSQIFKNPGLRAVDIEWASGLILASRAGNRV